jgi:hypothetical protein
MLVLSEANGTHCMEPPPSAALADWQPKPTGQSLALVHDVPQ